jgi:hypothetical protein
MPVTDSIMGSTIAMHSQQRTNMISFAIDLVPASGSAGGLRMRIAGADKSKKQSLI